MIEKFYLNKDEISSGMTTPGQSGAGTDGNEGILHIPQITIRCSLVSYPGHF